MIRAILVTVSLLTGALAAPTPKALSPYPATKRSTTCFPFGGAKLPTDYSAPSTSRSEWWCPQSEMYGFLGFSYPLEVPDCSDYTNSYDSINSDFAKMKRDFGASMVRVYAPECRDSSVWENLLRAAVNNNMGVIPQVWWGFEVRDTIGFRAKIHSLSQDDQNLWKKTQSSIYSVMESSKYGAIAPHVFHSAAFGSEPIGDGVDGDSFIGDLGSFRAKMNSYGIPVAISEDWDRPGTMSSSDGSSLGDVGEQVKQNSDMVHGHAMPFYHNKNEGEAWNYIQGQVKWYKNNVGLPALISEVGDLVVDIWSDR